MNDKTLLKNDREDFLNNSMNHSTISSKSVDNHFLNFSDQRKVLTQQGILY